MTITPPTDAPNGGAGDRVKGVDDSGGGTAAPTLAMACGPADVIVTAALRGRGLRNAPPTTPED